MIAHGGHEIASETYLAAPRGWLLCPDRKKRHTPTRGFVSPGHHTKTDREESDYFPREQGCDCGAYRRRWRQQQEGVVVREALGRTKDRAHEECVDDVEHGEVGRVRDDLSEDAGGRLCAGGFAQRVVALIIAAVFQHIAPLIYELYLISCRFFLSRNGLGKHL